MPRWNFIIGVAVCLYVLATLYSSAHALEPQKKPHQENHAQLMVDVVFGLNASQSAPEARQPLGATQSLLFAGFYTIAESLHVGARAAVTIANGVQSDTAAGAMAALSNTELEGEHIVRLSPNTEATLGLALILPTAQGHEPEDDLFAEELGQESAAALTGMHGELSEAAAASRGFEDGALFRAERVGLIPKVHLHHHDARLRLESHVKLENLLSVRSAAHHRYLGELVVGGFYGYDIFKAITLGVRLWSNVLLEKTEETNLVCEPQVQIHGKHIQGLIGALMAVVQRPNAPTGLMGVRLAAAALF